MKRKRLYKSAVLALAFACCLSQVGTTYAAAVSAGTWTYDSSRWKYYTESGTPYTGWVNTESGWYYLNPVDGTMQWGWLQDGDGTWYYLNTEQNEVFGRILTGWQWIDGYCYYFEPVGGAGQGKMYAGQKTPDGFWVNKEGCWTDENGVVQYVEGKGIQTTTIADNKVALASAPGSSDSGSDSGSGSGGGSNSGSNDDSDHDLGNSGDDNAGNQTPEVPDAPEIPSTPEVPDAPEIPSTPEIPDTPDGEGEEDTAVSFLNEEQTKVFNLGWIQYVVISFKEGTVEDYSLLVDGTDITAACTNVDNDGSIVKWETTVVKPGSLTAVRADDQRSQTVILGSGIADDVLPGWQDSAPTAILTNGPVSSFDYYLDVYDKDGNVRVTPDRTTFDLGGDKEEGNQALPSDYYIPDILIDMETGNGQILVKLALNTDQQKNWFNSLRTIKALGQENNVLNQNLPFQTSVETSYGTTGVIKILLPQTNLFSRGRYQLNLTSDYSQETMTLPIHLVDSRKFTMQINGLNANPKTGECFAFHIQGPKGETFGNEILSPIYRVDLTDPSGTIRTLTNITDWYEIGDMLHICGTNTNEELVTSEGGIYTVTAYANGYQTMEKRVEIAGGRKDDTIGAASFRSYDVDGISSATSGGSSGGGGDSSGGGSVNAFLIFDHDLIVNALLVGELGIANEEAEAVITRWSDQSPVAVMDEEASALYDFIHYLNAVKDARLEVGATLSFQSYTETQTGGETLNRPYQIKRVLEDGLLGSSVRFSETTGTAAPKLEYTEAAYGQDLTLSCATDSDYIGAIRQIYLDDSGTELRDDDDLSQYKISEDQDTVTIYYQSGGTAGGQIQLGAGTHTLRMVADGYQTAIVSFEVKTAQEQFTLALNPNPEAKETEDPFVYYTDQDVHIVAAAEEEDEEQEELRGDFLKNLTKVSLTNPSGTTATVTSESAGQIGGNDNYSKKAFELILQQGLFETEGIYTVTVFSEGYTPKLLEFEIVAAIVEPEDPDIGTDDGDDLLPVPHMKSAAYYAGMMGNPYYRVAFDGLGEEELATYLQQENKTVTVNGVEYQEVKMSFWNDSESYKISTDEAYGIVKFLDFTPDGFTEEENVVSIEVEGYETLEFHVRKSKSNSLTSEEIQEEDEVVSHEKETAESEDIKKEEELGEEAVEEEVAEEEVAEEEVVQEENPQEDVQGETVQ